MQNRNGLTILKAWITAAFSSSLIVAGSRVRAISIYVKTLKQQDIYYYIEIRKRANPSNQRLIWDPPDIMQRV